MLSAVFANMEDSSSDKVCLQSQHVVLTPLPSALTRACVVPSYDPWRNLAGFLPGIPGSILQDSLRYRKARGHVPLSRISLQVTRDLAWMTKSPDALGNSIYDQLSAALVHILKTRPENPVENFESLISTVKDLELDPAYTKRKPLTFRDIPDTVVAAEGCALYKPVELSVNANGQQTTVVDPIECYIPDLVAEASMLEWAGVSLRAEEQYRLQLAMRRLAHHDRSLKARWHVD